MSKLDKPRVDFYKLNSQSTMALNRFCCQLADKVVKLGHSVYVRTQSEDESRMLDDLMWTFSDNSFLPHAIQHQNNDPDAPVTIGHEANHESAYLLINLSDDVPSNTGSFERIAEIINDAPQLVNQGRARYAAYKQEDYPLQYHEINI